MTRFPALHALLTGNTAGAETPPRQRRGSPNSGLNSNSGTQDMVVALAKNINAPQIVTTPQAIGERPLESIIRPGRMEITPALARRILDDANYDRQRGVYKSSLEDAENLIRGDDWIDGYQIWFALVNGELHLLDGQHRMSGVWSTGLSRVFQVEVLNCATLAEAHDLYARMDRFGRKRTDSEMLNAVGLADELGVSRNMAKAAFKAAPYLADNFQTGRYGRRGPLPTDKDKVDFIRPWSRLAKTYADAIASAETDLGRALMNPGIVAIGLLTLRDQPVRAHEFWEGTALNDGLRRGDPRHTFITALRNRNFNKDGLGGVRLAATAWNAFYEGRKISFIRIYDDAAVRITGVRRPK